MGDAREAALFWDRAVSEVASRPELLWYMARYAERLGETTRAVQIYQPWPVPRLNLARPGSRSSASTKPRETPPPSHG